MDSSPHLSCDLASFHRLAERLRADPQASHVHREIGLFTDVDTLQLVYAGVALTLRYDIAFGLFLEMDGHDAAWRQNCLDWLRTHLAEAERLPEAPPPSAARRRFRLPLPGWRRQD